MEIKEYISSGILESYVMGLCTPEEIQQVEKYMDSNVEVRNEVVAIREALDTYGSAFEKVPPAGLKDQIWNRIESEGQVKTQAKVIPFVVGKKDSSVSRWMIAASFFLLAITAAMNVYLYSKWKSVERQIAEIRAEKDLIASQFEVQQTNLANIQQEFSFLQHPSTKKVFMNGVPSHPEALATVFWNDGTNEVFLHVNNLPEIPAGKQYQLWAIVDGQPVDAGMINHEITAFQKMKDFSRAQTFAITLEQEGGSAVPNLEALFVIGNI